MLFWSLVVKLGLYFSSGYLQIYFFFFLSIENDYNKIVTQAYVSGARDDGDLVDLNSPLNQTHPHPLCAGNKWNIILTLLQV